MTRRTRFATDPDDQTILASGSPWSDLCLSDLDSFDESHRLAWMHLLTHCAQARTATPTPRWRTASREQVERIGPDTFASRVIAWLERFQVLKTDQHDAEQVQAVNALYADTLRGLIFACADFDHPGLPRALARTALSAYRKLPGVGPRAVKIGNAAIWSLGQIPGEAALGQLALLRVKLKPRGAQKAISKALAEAAQRLQLPADEIDELAVPTYGLDAVGRLSKTLGDHTAVLQATGGGGGGVELSWFGVDGKQRKSVPAAVRRDHSEELAELRQTAKDLQGMLAAQRDRIDNLFLQQKAWPLPVWRTRYLDHPVVGVAARRLIWNFRPASAGVEAADPSSTGIWHDGRLVDAHDRPLNLESLDDATVSLWHPLDSATEEVLAWRAWLVEHEITQPFKQAHREVYLLTDAERRTGAYSNRFAAHVLRQHQFHALCQLRGWRDQLRLMVDAIVPPPSKHLPQWGLRAEFWVEAIGDGYGVDTNDSGVFHYIATDQVRFYRQDAPQMYSHAVGGGYQPVRLQQEEPLSLEEIPPLVFSEVMRDVDLFVGVGSVGNDPTWQDGGPAGRFRDYWQSFSFGDLSATAQTRKTVLERLIPRLKIASRCSFDDRFLTVRGDIRGYKIHLGSGNILMTPNDQYLCIVPNSAMEREGEGVFLPFEGDRTLSIILSKALLLADDTKIRDPSIVSQLRN